MDRGLAMSKKLEILTGVFRFTIEKTFQDWPNFHSYLDECDAEDAVAAVRHMTSKQMRAYLEWYWGDTGGEKEE
jgi:hypothetical protein